MPEYATIETCRVCQNDKRHKSVCKSCARRYLQCRICGTEHLEFADKIGVVELRIANNCKTCGPSGNKLDPRLLKPKNHSVVKPEDSYMRRRIS